MRSTELLLTAALTALPGTFVSAQTTGCVCDSLLDLARSAYDRGRLDEADSLVKRALPIAQGSMDADLQGRIMMQQGLIAHARGNYVGALDAYLSAQRIRELNDDKAGMAEVYNSLGAIHQTAGDFRQAMEHYQHSMAIRTGLGNAREVAILHNNLGSLHEELGDVDSALHHHHLSLTYWTQRQDTLWQAIAHQHIGACHIQRNETGTARAHLTEAIRLSERQPRSHLRSIMFHEMGLTYLQDKDGLSAEEWCARGFTIARELDRLAMKVRCADCLSKAYDLLGRKHEALDWFKRWVALRDSLYSSDRMKDMARVELTHAFARRQLDDSLAVARERLVRDMAYTASINRERYQKRLFLVIGAAVVLLAAGLWNRLLFMRRSRSVIQQERDRSDALLLNILPNEVAQELKAKGQAEARRFEDVSILFTDFKDFTQVSERMSPEELVEELNACFRAFDAIIARHGIEKIKTIGDAYMAAGGVPNPSPDSTLRTVQAALEMQSFMRSYAAMREANGRPAFTMRAGVHTGPVVAGVVGDRKFQYDIWGDTVNTASRMETTGEPGRVNISADTYARLNGASGLRFIPRGQVEVKGKGILSMYFVEPAIPTAPHAGQPISAATTPV
ncbi:MAG: tetratricopeptide repeat protein [Flavobacteriales bacterium]|nr:tetratricopeptide repeat protein [Flavobacteriales bacterium]